MCVDGVEIRASANASANDCWTGGVETCCGAEAVVAGVDTVVRGSTTGIVADLAALGTD